MLKRLDRVASDTHGILHREAIRDRNAVRSVFHESARREVVLHAGIDRRNEVRSAVVLRVTDNALTLKAINFRREVSTEVYFNFELNGALYFFTGRPAWTDVDGVLEVPVPVVLYRAERRDARRAHLQHGDHPVSSWIQIQLPSNEQNAQVLNRSLQGLAVRVPEDEARQLPETFEIIEQNQGIGTERESRMYARVRHKTLDQAGLMTIGLSVSSVPYEEPVRIERRSSISIGARNNTNESSDRRSAYAKAADQLTLIELENDLGQSIRALENCWGERPAPVVIVIPPAWGQTKESLSPLALTIVETFRGAGEAVRVIRYDGTNRRGESHIDSDCNRPGNEYLHFTFSRAARDLLAVIRFLAGQGSNRVVIVSFSLSSIETRHALALSQDHVCGWVPVVGMADLQSALRTISGGIDYGYGLLNAVRFGRHELIGVVADMDRTGIDAIENRIGFLEDARREMAAIRTPITWIHGKYDAWMDLERVVEVMSCGKRENRKIIEVPTGHQLRTSRIALDTFRLIAEEASELALGRRLPGRIPPPEDLARVRGAEFDRLPPLDVDLRSFWRDYLLGRDRVLGMELLTATAAYRNFMEAQIRSLDLVSGARIVDLGCGVGEFFNSLRDGLGVNRGNVIEIDYIKEVVLRARSRRDMRGAGLSAPAQLLADLGSEAAPWVPIRSGSQDAVIASLLISYVPDSERLLREMFRLLRPGGRVVVSSMTRDADISRIYSDGLTEFVTPEARATLTDDEREGFEQRLRNFLNDGSRLIGLEERGQFRFFDAVDLRDAIARAGFVDISVQAALGEPPQAVIASASRPGK